MPDVPRGWRSTTIGEVLTLQRGFDITKAEQEPGDIPVFSSGGISSYHSRARAHGPGVIMGRKGTLGRIFYSEGDYWPHDTTLWVKDFKGNHPRFVYYFLRTIDFLRFDVGSANPTLNRNHIHPLPISWPPRSVQEDIARLLGALDDKIVINGKLMAASLKLAEAYYIQRTFTTDGRRYVKLADAAKWLSGGTPRTNAPEFWDGSIPWISAASLKSPWIDRSDRNITPLGAQNGARLVPAGSVIFVVRGMSLKTEFRLGIAQREVAFGQDCKALIANEGVDPLLLFYSLQTRRHEILAMVDEAGHGTGRLQTERLAQLEIPVPSKYAQRRALEVIEPLSKIAARRQAENYVLAELRDALLPKLISGDLRIGDAEKSAGV